MTVTVREVGSPELMGLISSKLDANVGEEWRRTLTNFALASQLSWIGENDGEVLCFYGLIAPTMLSDQAYLWMHTTPALKEHTFVLIRHSQRAIKSMLKVFETIHGHCEVGADRSQAWLRLIGAKFGQPEGHLVPFEIRSR